MNSIKGIIVEIHKNKAVLLTPTGEFIEVFATKNMNIGEEYSKTSSNISFIRSIPKSLAAALLMFTLLGGGLGAYYTPVATLNLSINPSVQLKTNLFNKVIYSTALNSDGKAILDNINVKNKNFNDALCLIVTESENQKFITEDYKANKSISLEVTGKSLNMSTFESTVHEHGISLEIKINNKPSISNKESNNKNSNLINSNKDSNKPSIENNSKNKTKHDLENANSDSNSNMNDVSPNNKSYNKQDEIKAEINKDNKNYENNNNKNEKDENFKKNLDEKNNSNSEPKKKNNPSSNKSLKKEK